MAHHDIKRLYGSWRAQISAKTFDHSQQVNAFRFRHGLNVGVQNRLSKKGANRKVMLGQPLRPKFIEPRGRAWLRIAELSGL